MIKKKQKCLVFIGVMILFLVSFGAQGVIAKTKISLWVGQATMFDFLESAGEDYEKLYPDIDVEVVMYAQRSLEQKISATLPIGQSGDIMFVNTMVFYPYYLMGNMASVPADTVAWFKEKFPEVAIDAVTAPETKEFVCFPLTGIVHAMFYNKTYFAEAGLAGMPETLDEQMDYAKRLVKRDASGKVIRAGLDLRLSGGAEGTTEKFWCQTMIPYGTAIVEPVGEKWRAAYDNERGYNALKYYIDAIHEYKVETHDIKTDAEGFGLGLSAMFQREAWLFSYLRANAPDIDYGVFLMPKGPGGWGTVANSYSMGVSKSGASKKGIWELCKYLVNDENTVKMVLESGWQSYRTNVDYSPVYKAYPEFKVFTDALNTPGHMVYDYPLLAPVREIFGRFAERITKAFKRADLLDNPKGIAQVMDKAAEETNKILAEYDLLAK